MLSNPLSRKQSLARIFALVALLCAGALQIQEAGHDHWKSIDDSYSQCLICKIGATALPSVMPLAVPPPVRVFNQALPAALAPTRFIASFRARGPPAYS